MLLDAIIGILAPHTCVGCGQEGTLLCFRCGDILSDPTIYLPQDSGLNTIGAVTVYEELAKDLVRQLKFRGARAAAMVMARHMVPLIRVENACLVPVPTATRRVRQRGFDQAKLLARQLSVRTGSRYMDCLRRYGQTHQVGASRQERLTQLKGAFQVKNNAGLDGRRIILVDDVITTGATLEAAAATLKEAGAGQIDAVVFACAELYN